MVRLFYSEYGIENIARRVLTAYDARLYYGQPSAIPIEDLIEANGLSLEYQYLRKNGRILGKTIFDDGLEAVYDMERRKYTLFPVRAGTILVDASLCEEDASTGRFRFTCAHEFAHWCLHKKLYLGTPFSTLPGSEMAPLAYSRLSVKVVFPASTWARIPILLFSCDCPPFTAPKGIKIPSSKILLPLGICQN